MATLEGSERGLPASACFPWNLCHCCARDILVWGMLCDVSVAVERRGLPVPGPEGDSGQRDVMLGSECRQKSPDDWQRFVTHAKNILWFKRCWLCINSSYQHEGAETASASTWASMFAPSQRAAGCCLPAPSQPTPVAAGSSEPLGMGETPASTPSQPSALGSKPSVKWQREKRGLGVFSCIVHSESQPWAFHGPVWWVVVPGQRSLDLPL